MVRIPEIIILFYYSLNLYLLIVKLIFTDYTIFNIKKKNIYTYINKVITNYFIENLNNANY